MKNKFNKKTMKMLSLSLSIIMLGVFITSSNVRGDSLELGLDDLNDFNEEDYANSEEDQNNSNNYNSQDTELEDADYEQDDYEEVYEEVYEDEDIYEDYDYSNDGLHEKDYNSSNSYNNYDDFTYNSGYDDFFYSDSFEYDNFGSDLDWGYGEDKKEEHIPGENFLRTPKTIQYTHDSTSKYPKYIDTGIKVEENNTIQIEGLKELFRQLSVETDIKVVEDINRVMVLVNGKLYIITGGITTIEELEKVLGNMNITLKAQDTRAGGKFNLADYLEYKKEIIVEVNGKVVELLISPSISNSRVLFPIRSIGEAMGADVSWNSKKAEATLKKDGKRIALSANNDIVMINEKEYLISQETAFDKKEERLFSLIGLIVTEFNGEMSWNSNKLILEISSPQEIIDLDKYL